jgi:hypothetical protein
MAHGQLVKVVLAGEEPAEDRMYVLYVVGVDSAAAAVEIIKANVAREGDLVESMGRASPHLLQALHVPPGGYCRA